ncbi:hypothetical protein SAMN05216387_102392 [Nitrosovibrio tenuis]|uniref:Uncharacterized protein n=1 Tax=Nitrosovibrio tenuis TaxID=1233 RepID=A0A1H7J5C8_9PROT|nr:hypothetical protein SAMN05216387_102392 [Nitrosovibrio tenuis]
MNCVPLPGLFLASYPLFTGRIPITKRWLFHSSKTRFDRRATQSIWLGKKTLVVDQDDVDVPASGAAACSASFHSADSNSSFTNGCISCRFSKPRYAVESRPKRLLHETVRMNLNPSGTRTPVFFGSSCGSVTEASNSTSDTLGSCTAATTAGLVDFNRSRPFVFVLASSTALIRA